MGKNVRMTSPSPMARRVRDVRTIAGLSQRKVSVRAGLDPSHVRLLEGSGQRTAATTISKIADALGVRGEYLITGELPAFECAPEVDPAKSADAPRVRELVLLAFGPTSITPDRPPPPTPKRRTIPPPAAAAPRASKRKVPKRKAATKPGLRKVEPRSSALPEDLARAS